MADTETCTRRDWADWSSDRRSYVLAWGLPTALLILAIFMPPPIRTAVWAGALIWMGVACIANAARCGRTHCYLTGPLFLGHGDGYVAHGIGVISVGSQGWLWIGIAIAVGTAVLWIVPERLFGRFLTNNRSG
jgi:hypothetical protein